MADEALIIRAAMILGCGKDRQEAIDILVAEHVSAESAYLAVIAAEILSK